MTAYLVYAVRRLHVNDFRAISSALTLGRRGGIISNHMVTKASLSAVQRDDVFRAVADPTRRAILDRLRDGPANVNSIAAAFDQTRPGISKHLRVLRECHLVRETRAGRERVYELLPEPITQIADWAAQYQAFWKASLGGLKSYLENEE